MKGKEFHEMVDFGLVLNEWASTQPGHKSAVTEADVEDVMAKLRKAVPLKRSERSELEVHTVATGSTRKTVVLDRLKGRVEVPPEVARLAVLRSLVSKTTVGTVSLPEKQIRETEPELIRDGLLTIRATGTSQVPEITPAGRQSLETGLQNREYAKWLGKIVDQPPSRD